MGACGRPGPVDPADDKLAFVAAHAEAFKRRTGRAEWNVIERQKRLVVARLDTKVQSDDEFMYRVIDDRLTLRYVRPYVFDRVMNVKERWSRTSISDALASELYGSDEHWGSLFDSGMIRLWQPRRNFAQLACLDKNALLSAGTRLVHRYHVHERAIHWDGYDAHELVMAYSEIDGILAVRKPAGAPVHPSGNFMKNSLVEMLQIVQLEHGWEGLYPVHRLDAPVTGLCLLATSKPAAAKAAEVFKSRFVRKQYLAEVHGLFVPDSSSETIYLKHGIELDKAGNRQRRNFVDTEEGLEAITNFKLLHVYRQHDGTWNSILLCEPRSGRLHQIRVHLASLGHPIVNDPLYGERPSARPISKLMMDRNLMAKDRAQGGALQCLNCPCVAIQDDKLDWEPAIHLHAWCYEAESGWRFQSELPAWLPDDLGLEPGLF